MGMAIILDAIYNPTVQQIVAGALIFIGLILFSGILDAFIKGREIREVIVNLGDELVRHAEEDNRRAACRPSIEPLPPVAAPLLDDEISLYECDGCSRHFVRNQPGYVVVGGVLEFCSEDCHRDPLPFPVRSGVMLSN